MKDVLDAIRTKRAVRQFSDQPLPDDAIRAILDAGRRAQSSKNGQPWEFVAVTNRETLRQLAQTGDFAGHLAGAALGVVLVSPPGDERRERWDMFDLGQAAAYMQLAGWDFGIGSCIASIYTPEQARAILGIPAEMNCEVALSFGYPADEQQRRPAVVRPGGRKSFGDVVHWQTW